jgi:hypothetical protein
MNGTVAEWLANTRQVKVKAQEQQHHVGQRAKKLQMNNVKERAELKPSGTRQCLVISEFVPK